MQCHPADWLGFESICNQESKQLGSDGAFLPPGESCALSLHGLALSSSFPGSARRKTTSREKQDPASSVATGSNTTKAGGLKPGSVTKARAREGLFSMELPKAPDKKNLLGITKKREEDIHKQKELAAAKAALVAQEAAAIQHAEVPHAGL